MRAIGHIFELSDVYLTRCTNYGEPAIISKCMLSRGAPMVKLRLGGDGVLGLTTTFTKGEGCFGNSLEYPPPYSTFLDIFLIHSNILFY